MDRLKGKAAIITGASSGLGQGKAELFAKEIATVVLTARRVNKLDALADRLKKRAYRHWLSPAM